MIYNRAIHKGQEHNLFLSLTLPSAFHQEHSQIWS